MITLPFHSSAKHPVLTVIDFTRILNRAFVAVGTVAIRSDAVLSIRGVLSTSANPSWIGVIKLFLGLRSLIVAAQLTPIPPEDENLLTLM